MSGLRWTEEQLRQHTNRITAAVDNAPQPLHTPRENEANRQKASPQKVKTGNRGQQAESPLEAMLEQQMTLSGIKGFVRQHKHLPGRNVSLDFAWPERKIGIEVQGMVHRIKSKFEKDIEKRALGQLAGWRVLEVSGSTIRGGQAVQWIRDLLEIGSVVGLSRGPV